MGEKLSVPLDEFKDREIEIINLIADGLSNQEIADHLFITKGTVRWYNKQIYSKLGTSRRTEAIAVAREMGLIGDEQTDVTTTHLGEHKLPITTGPFIGRDNEIAELTGLLDEPEIRLLSIVATGGMGKSRISLELAHQIKHTYQDGAAFIDLAPVQSATDIAQSAVSSLGLSLTGQRSAEEVVFDYCRAKELLLIFDNFEHVLTGASFLSNIIEVAPKVTIIATSRERLNLRAETAFYLQPIAQDAIELFIEVARMMRPNFDINERELEDVERIVELTGGLPLGLILAATWVDALSIPEIADEIETNLEFLSAEMGDMPERQRSMHAVIDPTWHRLNEKEKEAFAWASVFRGGFIRETFHQLIGVSPRTIQTLLNRSLITHGYGRRYDMHPLLRQYAREKLEASGKLNEAKQGHLHAFLNYAEMQNERMYSGYYLESLDVLNAEQDNFRAALDWSLSGYEVDTGIALILHLGQFWVNRSQIKEAMRYIEFALDHSATVPELHMWASFYQFRLGHMKNAENYARKAISLAEKNNSLATLANSYRNLAMLNLNDMSHQEKIALLHKAIAIAEEIGSDHLVARCHTTMGGLLYNWVADPEIILEHCQKALTFREKSGDLGMISVIVYNMALTVERLGDNDRARELCEYSLELKRRIGDRAGIARRLSVLAGWDIVDEEFDRAHQYLEESRAIAEELGEKRRLRYILFVQGALFVITGDYTKARKTLEMSLQLAIDLEENDRIEHSHAYLALLYLTQGQIEESKPHIRQAVEVNYNSEFDPRISVTAYANYLWYRGQYDDCVSIVAVLSHELGESDYGYTFSNQYFLRPLIYRMKEKIGEEAWQDAVATAADITIQQVFQKIVNDLGLK